MTFVATTALLHEGDHDQYAVIARIAEAGADGIEIREELFTGELSKSDLQILQKRCSQVNLTTHYSSSVPILRNDSSLNPEVYGVLYRAKQLNAKLVKLSLGNSSLETVDLKTLRQIINLTQEYASIRITIENDQTEGGGRLKRLKAFFELCQANDVPIGMTFDLGNWLWIGEDPVKSARHLKEHVWYIHVKSADTSTFPPRTVAIEWESPRDQKLVNALSILPNSCPRCVEYRLTDCSVTPLRNHVYQMREFGKELLA